MTTRFIGQQIGLLLSLGVLLATIFASPALAAGGATGNLHFCNDGSPTFTINPNGTVTSAGSVCGAGSDDITAVLSETAIVHCANPGKNTDVPGQRETVTSPSTLLTPVNGRAAFDLTTNPTTSTCPSSKWTRTVEVTGATLSFYQNGALVLAQTLL